MEKVSVIIPCYNGEKFIDRSIKSIYIQEYPEIELIVVDDGSTDNSKEKILAWKVPFEEKGYLLKYVYQENGGLGSAINTGLKHVTGDYISLLDADDEYLSDILGERVAILQEHPDADVVRSNGWIVKGEDKRLFVTNDEEKQIENVFLALLKGETNNWAGSYMVRSKALFDFYPDREIYTSRFGQNLQLLLPLTYNKKCIFVDKPHMNYIQQNNSLSQTTDSAISLNKSIENAKGYRDIRVHMLNLIVEETAEKRYYSDIIECGYYRSLMNIALSNNNVSLFKQFYQDKLEYEKPSLNEQIVYYSFTSKIITIILKIKRRIISYSSKIIKFAHKKR